MFVRRRRWNSLKLLLWFLFQHPLAITPAIPVTFGKGIAYPVRVSLSSGLATRIHADPLHPEHESRHKSVFRAPLEFSVSLTDACVSPGSRRLARYLFVLSPTSVPSFP